MTAAFTRTLRLFFGTVFNQERHFGRFSDAEAEVVEARILLGIHFRSADEEARRLGNRVAQWTFMHYLRPMPPEKR